MSKNISGRPSEPRSPTPRASDSQPGSPNSGSASFSTNPRIRTPRVGDSQPASPLSGNAIVSTKLRSRTSLASDSQPGSPHRGSSNASTNTRIRTTRASDSQPGSPYSGNSSLSTNSRIRTPHVGDIQPASPHSGSFNVSTNPRSRTLPVYDSQPDSPHSGSSGVGTNLRSLTPRIYDSQPDSPRSGSSGVGTNLRSPTPRASDSEPGSPHSGSANVSINLRSPTPRASDSQPGSPHSGSSNVRTNLRNRTSLASDSLPGSPHSGSSNVSTNLRNRTSLASDSLPGSPHSGSSNISTNLRNRTSLASDSLLGSPLSGGVNVSINFRSRTSLASGSQPGSPNSGSTSVSTNPRSRTSRASGSHPGSPHIGRSSVSTIPRSPRNCDERNERDPVGSPGQRSETGSTGSSHSYSSSFRTQSQKSSRSSTLSLPRKQFTVLAYDEIVAVDLHVNDKLEKWTDYFGSVEYCLMRYYREPDKLFDYWNCIINLRQILENLTKHILKESVVVFSTENIHTRTWLTGYYQCVCVLRNLKDSVDLVERPTVETYFEWILNKGIECFGEFLNILKVNYGLVVQDIVTDLSEDAYSRVAAEKHHGIAVMAKIYIWIGDLHRYFSTTAHMYQARENYEFSRRLFPYKGRAYSQLAQIAVYRADIISNVYYNTRAMIAKYPADGCRHQLLDIFDKVYKMHKEMYVSSWYYRSKWSDKKQHGRKEIWIYSCMPESEPDFDLIPQTMEEHLSKLSCTDRFHRFVVSYLNLIGKFFTKIGVDDIMEVAEATLVYFKSYMQDTARVKFHRLMQIATMNIYILHLLDVEKQTNKIGAMYEDIFMSFFLEMLSLVAENLIELIRQLRWNSSLMQTSAAFVMVCCDWLGLSAQSWTLQRPRPTFSIRCVEMRVEDQEKHRPDDIWVTFASLMTEISPVVTRYREALFPSVKKTPDEVHAKRIILPERTTMDGFKYFIAAPLMQTDYFVQENRPIHRARTYIRLKSIFDFGLNFLATNTLIKSVELPTGVTGYINNSKVRKSKTKKPAFRKCGLDREHYHYWTEDFRKIDKEEKPPTSLNRNHPDACNARVIVKVRKDVSCQPKPSLEPIVPPEVEMPVYEIYTKLFNQRMRTDIIITPKRIILDTNCFILYMNHVMMLTRLVPFPIFVPVTVILELKGLQKGGFTVKDRKKFKSESDPGAAEKLASNQIVATACKAALEFINEHLGDKFLVVTCFGRIAYEIKNIFRMIKDDFYDQTKTNDERIMAACYHMESYDKPLRAKDLPHRIYRNTILLTSDRMMHISSFDYNIPTRHISAFTFWINELWSQHNAAMQRSESPPPYVHDSALWVIPDSD